MFWFYFLKNVSSVGPFFWLQFRKDLYFIKINLKRTNFWKVKDFSILFVKDIRWTVWRLSEQIFRKRLFLNLYTSFFQFFFYLLKVIKIFLLVMFHCKEVWVAISTKLNIDNSTNGYFICITRVLRIWLRICYCLSLHLLDNKFIQAN